MMLGYAFGCKVHITLAVSEDFDIGKNGYRPALGATSTMDQIGIG